MKYIVRLSILTLIFNSFFVKAQDYEWNRGGSSRRESDAKAIITHRQHVFVGGDFIDTISFGNERITVAPVTNSKSGFVLRCDTSGAINWLLALSGTTPGREVTLDGITIDNSGNLLVTGKFVTGVKIGNTTLSEPNNKKAIYTTKIDSSGKVLWTRAHFGSASVEIEGKRLVTDNAENVYVCGKIKGGIVLIGSDTLAYNPTAGENTFIIKYKADGTTLWAKTIGNASKGGKVNMEDLGIDRNGNIVISGKLEGTAEIGNGTTKTLTSTGGENFFIAKLNPSGGLLWSALPHSNTGTNKNNSKSLKVGNDGSVYAIGDFDNGIAFDESSANTFNSMGKNGWIAKWSSNGQLLWTLPFLAQSSSAEFKPDGIAIDSLNDVLVVGRFTNTVRIGSLNPITATAGKNTFLTKINNNGRAMWVNATTSSQDIEGKRVDIDVSGKAIIGGSYRANASFGGKAGDLVYSGQGGVKTAFFARNAAGMVMTQRTLTNLVGKTYIKVNIFPNPTTNVLNVIWPDEVKLSKVLLHDYQGRLIYEQETESEGNGSLTIDLSNLKSGNYLLSLVNEFEVLNSQMIIKN